MLQAIIKGDVNSISAKLELKLDEYLTSNLLNTPLVNGASYFSVPKTCN